MLKVIAHLAPIVVLGTIATLAVLGSFFTTSPWLLALYVLALALAIWARSAFPAGAFRAGPLPAGAALIRRGPYRFVRHPMYSAALLLVWGGVFARLTWGTAALGVLVTGMAVARVVYEENMLRAAFTDYGEYARSTRALIPFIA